MKSSKYLVVWPKRLHKPYIRCQPDI